VLNKINIVINWEVCRPTLEKDRKKEKKSATGAKGLMFARRRMHRSRQVSILKA